jgi:hypothetical protein
VAWAGFTFSTIIIIIIIIIIILLLLLYVLRRIYISRCSIQLEWRH